MTTPHGELETPSFPQSVGGGEGGGEVTARREVFVKIEALSPLHLDKYTVRLCTIKRTV